MTIQLFDGYDDYGTTNQAALLTRFVSLGTSAAQTPIAGAFGGLAIGVLYNYAELAALLTPVSTFIVSKRFQWNGAASSNFLGFSFNDSAKNVIAQVSITGATVATITAKSNGAIYYNAANISGTLLGSIGGINLLASTWYYLEAECTVGTGVSGSIIVRLNGVVVLSLPGINTQGTAGALICYAGTICGGATWYIDDFVGNDTTGPAPYNTFLSGYFGSMGPKVYTGVPTANYSCAFTPYAGSNFSEVNKVTYSTATYNYSQTAGQTDLFSFAGGVFSVIAAVQTTYVANQDDAGTKQTAGVINSGGTNYYGATQTLTVNPTKYVDLWLTDPATGATWAPSKFSATPSVYNGYTLIS